MNLDYQMALKRARDILLVNEVSEQEKEHLISIFPELSYTPTQESIAKLLNLLEDIYSCGKNANFDRFDKYDCSTWIETLKKVFFKTVWHDSNIEQPQNQPTVVVYDPSRMSVVTMERCVEVCPNRFWANLHDIVPGVFYIDVSDDPRTKVFAVMEKLQAWFDSLPNADKMRIMAEYPEFVKQVGR